MFLVAWFFFVIPIAGMKSLLPSYSYSNSLCLGIASGLVTFVTLGIVTSSSITIWVNVGIKTCNHQREKTYLAQHLLLNVLNLALLSKVGFNMLLAFF